MRSRSQSKVAAHSTNETLPSGTGLTQGRVVVVDVEWSFFRSCMCTSCTHPSGSTCSVTLSNQSTSTMSGPDRIGLKQTEKWNGSKGLSPLNEPTPPPGAQTANEPKRAQPMDTPIQSPPIPHRHQRPTLQPRQQPQGSIQLGVDAALTLCAKSFDRQLNDITLLEVARRVQSQTYTWGSTGVDEVAGF